MSDQPNEKTNPMNTPDKKPERLMCTDPRCDWSGPSERGVRKPNPLIPDDYLLMCPACLRQTLVECGADYDAEISNKEGDADGDNVCGDGDADAEYCQGKEWWEGEGDGLCGGVKEDLNMDSHPPICVAIPSTSAEKMKAIVALSNAVEKLAIALISTNTTIRIENCHIRGTQTAIDIKTSE